MKLSGFRVRALRLLDASHFTLENHGAEATTLMPKFLERNVG
jgi:hypothetical protein